MPPRLLLSKSLPPHHQVSSNTAADAAVLLNAQRTLLLARAVKKKKKILLKQNLYAKKSSYGGFSSIRVSTQKHGLYIYFKTCGGWVDLLRKKNAQRYVKKNRLCLFRLVDPTHSEVLVWRYFGSLLPTVC